MKELIIKNKTKAINIIQILMFPILLYVLEIAIRVMFNIGLYAGTFVRSLYQLVVTSI